MEACEVIAGGGPGDFPLVRHVRLEGIQAEIGSGIARLAWANHGVRPQPSADPALTHARRRWIESSSAGEIARQRVGSGRTCGQNLVSTAGGDRATSDDRGR